MDEPLTDQTVSIDSPLLSGTVHQSLFWLALPALGEQLLNYCVGLFDTFLAGQVHLPQGEVGLATSAVGVAAYLSWLASLLFVLVGTGTSALVARAWGAGRYDEANRITNCSIPLAGLLGILVAGLVYVIAPGYARLQNMQGESYRIVVHFLRTDAIGELLYVFCIVGAGALRGAGDMRSPMLLLGLVNILNIVLSSFFVFGFGLIEPWGLNGIVTGTVLARIAGGLAILAVLSRGISGLKLRWSLMSPAGEDVRRILWIGFPQVVDGILMWVGHSLFLTIISRLGDASSGKSYIAAHMIAVQVEALTYLPATAWGYAAATLIGQSLGAGKVRRALRTGHAAVLQCLPLAGCGALVYLFGAPLIYGIMTQESAVREIGVPAMRCLSSYQLPLVAMVVYIFALRGAGDTRVPAVINTFGILCVRLPVAWYFGLVLKGGLLGAWTGMFVDVYVRCALAWLWYRSGLWVKAKL